MTISGAELFSGSLAAVLGGASVAAVPAVPPVVLSGSMTWMSGAELPTGSLAPELGGGGGAPAAAAGFFLVGAEAPSGALGWVAVLPASSCKDGKVYIVKEQLLSLWHSRVSAQNKVRASYLGSCTGWRRWSTSSCGRLLLGFRRGALWCLRFASSGSGREIFCLALQFLHFLTVGIILLFLHREH